MKLGITQSRNRALISFEGSEDCRLAARAIFAILVQSSSAVQDYRDYSYDRDQQKKPF